LSYATHISRYSHCIKNEIKLKVASGIHFKTKFIFQLCFQKNIKFSCFPFLAHFMSSDFSEFKSDFVSVRCEDKWLPYVHYNLIHPFYNFYWRCCFKCIIVSYLTIRTCLLQDESFFVNSVDII
jgi:hypothetical protein